MTHEEYIVKKCVEAIKDSTSKNWWKTIGLADVLLAIEHHCEKLYLITVEGEFAEWRPRAIKFLGVYWNLRTNLHGQTDETKKLLAKALGYNE